MLFLHKCATLYTQRIELNSIHIIEKTVVFTVLHYIHHSVLYFHLAYYVTRIYKRGRSSFLTQHKKNKNNKTSDER